MAQNFLPSIPVEIMRRHRVHQPHDSRFRACARLLQALWREENSIPMGTLTATDGTSRKLGSRVSNNAGASGHNFMTGDIARLVWRENAYREPGAMIDEERLWTNLISSHPMTFNLVGPLRLDLKLASKVLGMICPDLAGVEAQSVAFEHSPGRRNPILTGDRTAFDAIITYFTAAGATGFVALELKYTESAWEPQKPLRDRYDTLMPESGLFIEPGGEMLRKPPFQQFMREHLLAQASIMRGDYDEGRFVVVAPALNLPVQIACQRYADVLAPADEKRAKFGVVTLEAFIDAIREHGDTNYADGLFRRYCDWSRIDAEIEASFPARLAR